MVNDYSAKKYNFEYQQKTDACLRLVDKLLKMLLIA